MKFKKKTLYILIIAGVLLTTGVTLGLNGFFGGGSSIPSDTFTRGLVGYWPMDESSGYYTYDSSGNNNTGTLGGYAGATSSDPKWATGKVGGALQFDGVDDYVNCGSAVTLGERTFEFWMKALPSTNWRNVLSFSGLGGTIGFTLGSSVSYNSKSLLLLHGASYQYFNSGSYLDGVWHHWVVYVAGSAIADIDRASLTIDGNIVSKAEKLNTGAPDVWSTFIIGRNGYGPFDSIIDDVRIYNRALSAAEVKYHYNRGGPVAQWTFDEGNGKVAFDSSGNNNSGHIFGPALSFDGTNDYVDAGSGVSLNITSQITIEAWVNPNSLPGNDKGIAVKFNAYGLGVYSNSVMFWLWGTSQYNWSGGTLQAGQWQHIVATHDTSSGISRIYINGVQSATTTRTGSISTSGVSLLVGRIGSGVGTEYFGGPIDEVRVYNRALSATEILDHYRGKYTDESGIAGRWYFDENTGQTTYDSSGNGNNGQLGSAPGADINDPTWVNYAPTWTTGKNGNALSFDGTDDYVDAGNGTSLQPTTAITVEAWINPLAGILSHNRGLVSFTPLGDNWGRYALVSSAIEKSVGFYVNNAAAGSVYTFPAYENWYHVVGVYDKVKTYLYVNGVLVDSDAYTADLTGSGSLYLGMAYRTTQEKYKGLIDDVRIYNYARMPEEIALDYNGGFAAHFGPSSSCDDDPGACMENGLLGYWNFEESGGTTAKDGSLNGNNGTLTNGPKWTTGIKPLSGGAAGGGALRFDGKDDYVDVGNVASFNTYPLTIEAWFNTDTILEGNTSGLERAIVNKYAGSSANGYNFFLDARANTFGGWYFADGSNYVNFRFNAGLTTGRWYHAVFVVGSNQGQIYINGTLASTSAAVGTLRVATTTQPLRFGIYDTAIWKGSIDEVRIYNRALSATEIRYHYNQGEPVAYWTFDDGSGQTAFDSSLNSNDGRLGSTTAADAGDPTWTTGKYGNALSFDGSNDYVSMADSDSLDIGTSDFTISFWGKISPTANTNQTFIEKRITGSPYTGYVLYFQTPGASCATYVIRAQVNAGTITDRCFNVGYDLRDNKWHHIVWKVDRDSTIGGEVYLDGISLGTGDFSSQTASIANSVAFQVGRSRQFTDDPVNGFIDDVRIYNYVRTLAQIQQDYNTGFAAHFGPTENSSSSACDDDPGACMEQGLVGYWGFEEGGGTTTYDGSSYANNGNLTNGPRWTTGIKPLSGGVAGGGALSFDGKDDMVQIPNSSSLDGMANMTVEVWVKINRLASEITPYSRHILAKGNDPVDPYRAYDIEMMSPTNTIRFNVVNAARTMKSVNIFTVTASDLGIWQHLVGTYDGAEIKVYRNGSYIAKTTQTGSVLDNNTLLTIGAWTLSGQWINPFGGLIDEVRIYNRALSATEVRYHYNQGEPVAYWKFDEGIGQTAFDESLNNNDGRLGSTTVADAGDPTWVAGKYGSALSFDGTNSYVEVPNFNLPSNNKLTFEFWLKTNTLSMAKDQLILAENRQTPVIGYILIRVSSGCFAYQYANGANMISLYWCNEFLDLDWHHFVVVADYDADTISHYKDGNLVITENIPNALAPATNSRTVYIGTYDPTYTQNFNGLIDEVRIYNYTRTQEQIMQDYNAGLSTYFK